MASKAEYGHGYTGFETSSISEVEREHIVSTNGLVEKPGSVEHLKMVGLCNLAKERGSVSWDDCSEEVTEDVVNVDLANTDLALSEYLRFNNISGCFPLVSLLGKLWSRSSMSNQE